MPVTLREIENIDDVESIPLTWWSFPGGERGVKLPETVLESSTEDPDGDTSHYVITCDFRGSNDIMDVLLLNNALKQVNPWTVILLDIPYFPYGRQDRVSAKGESFSLQVVANLFRSCMFYSIHTLDIHSDVLAGMFSPGILINTPQDELMYDEIMELEGNRPDVFKPGTFKYAVVSPDAGALKKIYPLARKLNCPVIQASKHRDVATGDITGTTIAQDVPLTDFHTLYVVDDICDGGRTFIELGKEIRKTFTGELVLIVTHGIFSKGMEVFEGIFDNVVAVNYMREDD
jgi:ribose-phosphate pyrophosphokinase